MKNIRWAGIVILIVVMGFLSALGLFADSSPMEQAGLVLVFLAGSAGVGALVPERWLLSGLCSWGAVLLAVLEISYRFGQDPIAGQQPFGQVLSIGLGGIGLALLGGYVGSRLSKQSRSYAQAHK